MRLRCVSNASREGRTMPQDAGNPSRQTGSGRAGSRRAVAIGLCLLLGPVAVLRPAAAGSRYLRPSATSERVLFAGETASGSARGTWRDGQLVSASPVGRMNYLLPEHPDNEVRDGVVRASVSLAGSADLTLVLRGSVPAPGSEELSGYGFSVERDTLVLYRWDHGVARPLGASVVSKGLTKRSGLELVVFLSGPQIAAFAYDKETLEQLGALTAHDTTWPAGQVGFRSHPYRNGETRFTRLAVEPTSSSSSSLQAAGVRAASEPTPFGSERLVVVADDTVPAWAQDSVVHQQSEPTRQTTLYFSRPHSVDRLERSGAQILAVTGQVPFWAQNEDFRDHRDEAPVPAGDGFDLSRSYKDHQMVERFLRAYQQRHPDVSRLVPLATTSRGNRVWALRVKTRPDQDDGRPAVVVCAGHHGSELLSIDYALDALDQVLQTQGRWLDELDLWFVPLVNPDGNDVFVSVDHWGGRKNARETNGNGTVDAWDGVDLNRNYPFRWGSLEEKGSRSWHRHDWFRGERPGSEAETQAMMNLGNTRKPVALVSFHTSGTMILSPYTIDGVTNPSPDPAWAVATELAEVLPLQPNRRKFKVRRNMYSVDGTDQDWHYWANGTLAYIVEGSHHNPADPAVRLKSIEGLRPLVPTLLDRILDGPGVSGRVVDPAGQPLPAVVTIGEITTAAGETWTARADGRFDRLLPEAGRYTVHTALEGYAPTTAVVEVQGREEVRIVMRPE